MAAYVDFLTGKGKSLLSDRQGSKYQMVRTLDATFSSA